MMRFIPLLLLVVACADTPADSDGGDVSGTDVEPDTERDSDLGTQVDTDTDTDTEVVFRSISDVREDGLPDDAVVLVGASVMALDGASVWVQDRAGLGNSIRVDAGSGVQVGIEQGDAVTVTGRVAVFDNDGAWSAAHPRVVADEVSAAGLLGVVVPTPVTGAELMASPQAYEGHLIALQNDAPLTLSWEGQQAIVGTVPMDLRWADLDPDVRVAGDTWDRITGIWLYDGEYALAPRQEDDFAGYVDNHTPTLPVSVTDHWSLSGYFSETPGTDSWQTQRSDEVPSACPERAGDALGACLAVTYDRDPDNDGVGPNFSGWFWQFPEGNWGHDADGDGQPDLPGYALPAGATQVSFWAWGVSGGEQVNFKAGLLVADGFQAESGIVTLTTVPTEYTIDLSASAIGPNVVGGFSWIMEWGVAPIDAPVQFYVDDVVWE